MNGTEIKTSRGILIVYSRSKYAKRAKPSSVFPVPMVNNAINQATPLESIGLGVHRSQVDEFNQMYADAGIVGASHKEDGTCVLESR